MGNTKRTPAAREKYRTGEHALTPGEYQKILAVCGTYEEEIMMKVAVGLGLRRADLSRIRISDIDLAAGSLSYLEQKKRDRIRVVPIGPELSRALKKYIGTLPGDQIFLFRWGASRYGDRTAHRRLQDLCDRAGIPRRPFHALRSTCIKHKQREGWTVSEVAALIGDTIRVVQEHYAVPSNAELRELMNTKEGV